MTDNGQYRAERIVRSPLCRMVLTLLVGLFVMPAFAEQSGPIKFKRISTQFIAALGAPNSNSGNDAQLWGIWREDPGPRGVWLKHFDRLEAAGGIAPARWRFDDNDWWLEENGMIMEKPDFPLPPGHYLVTGDRETTAVLTVHDADSDGSMRWELDGGATLYDVTHLRCRSARYRPLAEKAETCSPANAPIAAFRVAPGASMPPVAGCDKQDFAVLFIIGVAEGVSGSPG